MVAFVLAVVVPMMVASVQSDRSEGHVQALVASSLVPRVDHQEEAYHREGQMVVHVLASLQVVVEAYHLDQVHQVEVIVRVVRLVVLISFDLLVLP